MTKLNTILAVCSATLAVSSTAVAGSSTANKRLPKQVRQMHCLVGSWHGNGALTVGGKRIELSMRMDCEPTSGGHAITCKSRFAGGGMVHEETDLFGYDPNKRQYHWFAVTSDGDAHDHVASVPRGPTVNWKYKGLKHGKAFTENIAMTFDKRGSKIRFVTRATLGGTPMFEMVGTVRKR